VFMMWLIALSPVVKSLIVPGWGQMDFDRKTGIVMMAAEVAGWGYYFTLHRRQLDARQTYMAIAYDHSGATSFSDERIFALLENYPERDFYIMDLYAEARVLYPDDPEAREQYVRLNSIDADWEWDSISTFFRYQDYRIMEREVVSQKAIVGFVIFSNHIISALHAYMFGSSPVDVSLYPVRGGVGLAIKGSF